MKKNLLTSINSYACEKIRARMAELGLSYTDFVIRLDAKCCPDVRKRICSGASSVTADILAYAAELLGLEVIIREKENANITRERLNKLLNKQ